jgi:hypothetical protein
MVEAATLLDGAERGPAGAAYVDKRVAALTDLERALAQEHSAWTRQRHDAERIAADDDRQVLETRAGVHERLETAGRNSLDEIADLVRRAGDHGA